MIGAIFAAALLAVASATSVGAASLLYDGSAAGKELAPRAADNGIAGQFTVSAPVEVTQFGVGVDLSVDGNLNFVVFEGLSTLLYQSGAQAFADTGYFEALSPTFSLMLTPGNSYFFGVISDVSSSYGCCGSGGAQGVVTSVSQNSNPVDFDNPTNTGLAFAHIDVSLYSGSAVVPLPAALPMLVAAIGGLALMRRRNT